MDQKRFVLCSAAALLALAVACSKTPSTPVAPGSTIDATTDAAPDGSTLKTPAPSPVSPVNNAQPDSLVLVTNKVTGKFDQTLNPGYQFEIRTAAGTTLSACTATVGPGSGNTVSYTPSCALDFDQPHTWRVRARLGDDVGPWSAAATFRTPVGGYITANEIYDPLWTGRTVGQPNGVTFVNQGARLDGHGSRITYVFQEPLQVGEYSLMSTGYGEDSQGDKTKMMSMQEGFGNITANDYRFTAEKRGASYETPGAVQFRIIMGDADEHAGRIFDSSRVGVPFSDELWYFWKFTWGTGRAALEVRENGPRGRVIYADSRGTGGFNYRPVPHVIHVGANLSRGGEHDSSVPGAIYKNIWVSGRPRPTFPGE
jgi:hypothetical protein